MNLSDVIQEQKQKHPELSSLSTEHFTQILVNHILNLKKGTTNVGSALKGLQ